MNIVDFFLDIERNDLQYLLTNPHAKNTKKQQQMTSAYFQASRKMRKEESRDLTEEEKIKLFKRQKELTIEKFGNVELFYLIMHRITNPPLRSAISRNIPRF